MLVPAKRNFFDDFMMSPFDTFFDGTQSTGKAIPGLMKTDVKETDKDFQLTIDLPGAKKEDVSVELREGYLDVSAETKREVEDKDENGTYLRKERFEGKCSRSFYVGDEIAEDDIKARFDGGMLKITVPKKTQPEIEAKKSIAIEG